MSPPLDSITGVDRPAPGAGRTPAADAGAHTRTGRSDAGGHPRRLPPPDPRRRAAPDAEAGYLPLPDRWSIEYPPSPRIVRGRLLDPYNQNVLKGDRPVIGNSVFLVLTGVLDSADHGAPAAARGQRRLHREPAGARVLRQRPAVLHHPAGLDLRRALPGADRLQAQDLGAEGHRCRQPELPVGRGAQPRERRRARGREPATRGRGTRGSLRGGQARRPSRPPTISSPCARESSPSSPTSAASSSTTRTWAGASSATRGATAGSTTPPSSTSWRRTRTASSTPSSSASSRWPSATSSCRTS